MTLMDVHQLSADHPQAFICFPLRYLRITLSKVNIL